MSWSDRLTQRFFTERANGSGTRKETATRTAAGGLASAVSGMRPIRSRMLDYDHSLLWAAIALIGLGVVMVYSASIAMPDSPKYAAYRDYAFLVRHIASLLVAKIAAAVVFRVAIYVWDK